MGWSGGNDAFDMMAKLVVHQVSCGEMSEEEGITFLSTLIDGLREGDWDTYDASYYEYARYPVVKKAFDKAIPDAEWDEVLVEYDE